MHAIEAERAATILAETMLPGVKDRDVAKKHGISVRSIGRYRSRLGSDPELTEAVRRKMSSLESAWVTETPGALRAAVGFLKRAADEGDPTDPEQVHAVAGAFKLLSEALALKQMIDARISGQAGADRAPGRSLASAGGSTGVH